MKAQTMSRSRMGKCTWLLCAVLIALPVPMLSCYEVETSESAQNNLPEHSSSLPSIAASLNQEVVQAPTVITVPVSLPLPEREDLKREGADLWEKEILPTGGRGLRRRPRDPGSWIRRESSQGIIGQESGGHRNRTKSRGVTGSGICDKFPQDQFD